MAKTRVLIVEDDSALAEVLSYNFDQAGFDVTAVGDGQQGLQCALKDSPNLIILDLMLPKVDGLDVCRQLRVHPTTRNTPIVMLTAKAEEVDEVVGFRMGADDYVTKPFSVTVLMERVKALLRRRSANGADQTLAVSQGVMLDRNRHRAMAGDRVLNLTRSEFRLLDVLLRQPGRVFSRSELIDAALGEDTIVLDRTIDVHVSALRQKLGEHAELIETVRGIGYRFREPDAA